MTAYHNSRRTMAQMSVRSSYALDPQTSLRIKRLAKAWGVSQAEVIRRSVQQADQATQVMTPADVVARYVQGPLPRNKTQTRRLIQSLRALRRQDDDRRVPAPRG